MNDRILYIKDSVERNAQLAELLRYDDCKNKKMDSTHALLLRRIAWVYYELGNYPQAVDYCQRAIKVVYENVNKPDVKPTDLVKGYYQLGLYYEALNNFKERGRAFDSCASYGIRLNAIDRIVLRAIYTNVEASFYAGDYQNCIYYATTSEKLALDYTNEQEYVLNSRGWIIESLLKMNDFQAAEKLLANKIEEYKKAGIKKYFGVTYDQMAHVEMHKGNYEKAIFYLNQSLTSENAVKNFFNAKQELNALGYEIYFDHFKDDKKALSYLTKALYYNKERSVDAKDSIESLNICNRIANVYVQKKSFDTAFKYFQQAFDYIKKGSNENTILQTSTIKIQELKKLNYVSALLIDKGDAYQKKFLTTRNPLSLKDALRVYKIADQFLDTIKNGLSDLKSKLFWRSSAKRLYENAIEACHLQDNIEDAVYFFEKSRAVLLSDQLNEQRWTGEEDIQRMTQLKKKILKLEKDINTIDKSSDKYAALQTELYESKQKLRGLQELIKVNNPLYYQNFVETNSITLGDVRKKILMDHQALVELFSGDSAVYLLVITQQKNYFQKLDKNNFENLSKKYTAYFSSSVLINRDYNGFLQTAHQLHQLLFGTIDLPAGRIIISPDGQYFPFEALITDASLKKYFLTDHAVSYTYSARYLLNEFAHNTGSSSRNFLGFAPVKFSNGLTALSGSDRSLSRMENYFSGAASFIFGNASKNNFLNEFANYRIIQLYTHATDSGSSGEPTIYFADSTLALSELFYGQRPATDLIVLSACETALGKIHTGEGVFSFNRGFAALGIPSAVSNLWQVDDQATYKITELFYKYLARGKPLDEALQQAKKEFIETSSLENKLPYYWAAPILVGQSHKISLQGSSWKPIVAILLLLALAFWLERKPFNRARDIKGIAA